MNVYVHFRNECRLRKLVYEPVQVVAPFAKALATSCESPPDFLTIADLDQSELVETKHVLEALQYRVQM